LVGIWEEDEKGEEGIYIGFAALRVGEGFATRCASGYSMICGVTNSWAWER
jgi:hypothetical protein